MEQIQKRVTDFLEIGAVFRYVLIMVKARHPIITNHKSQSNNYILRKEKSDVKNQVKLYLKIIYEFPISCL